MLMLLIHINDFKDDFLKEFDNIIELKHYLDIDIEWEDLVEYALRYCDFRQNKIEDSYNIYGDGDDVDVSIRINKNGEIYIATTYEDEEHEDWDSEDYKLLAKNLSYWQMYQIIKNLTENEGE